MNNNPLTIKPGGKEVVINARFLTQPITGVQRFAVEICRQLKEVNPNLKLVAPFGIRHPELAAELDVKTFGKLTGHLWEQFELPLYLHKTGKPLLVNLCNTAPVYYRNKVVCIHDLASFINPDWFNKTFATVYKILMPRIASSSKRIITVSNFSKSSINTILKVPAKNIEVIYNAVSESFAPKEDNSRVNQYGRYVLAVSSIDPRKNLVNLIKGFILANIAGIKLVIVGAGSKVFTNPGLETLVNGRQDIVFTGYLSDLELASVYKNALMFVYPSLFEGFGIPPLEAMHCGCPTIVSGTTSLPEVCGDASFYVNPLAPEEIAQAITLFAQNKEIRNSFITKGYSRIKEFSWTNSAGRLAGILNTLK